jgi:2-keto-4-pentenoate hydratase/2-oxohepta-3-ene-1,7-dioic acid hydratase in catechol pathway
MRLVTYSPRADEAARPGALRGDDIVDLTPVVPSILALIEGGSAELERARSHVSGSSAQASLADVVLHAPYAPTSVRDFLCFENHLRASVRASMRLKLGALPAAILGALGFFAPPRAWYRAPMFYKGNRFAVRGPGDIVRPAGVTRLDYELEIACVIGARCRDVAKEHARDVIFGYTIFNDVTARDWQMHEMGVGFHLGPAKSKDFDGANAIGPVLVTADELPDPYALSMSATVNGVEWSRGSTAQMHWRFEDLIAHVSRGETLHPGELFGSGTVGTGCGLERGAFLADGDVVALTIDHIGTLTNCVRAA